MSVKSRMLVLIILFAVIVAGAVVAVRTTSESAAAKDEHCALMPDAIGLYTGNPVTQLGVKIGEIGKITPVSGGVRVDFTVEHDRQLPATVKAVTRSKSVLADRSLELVGNPGSGPTLADDECVPMSNSYTPKSISEITGSAGDLLNKIAPAGDTHALRGALDGMSDALTNQGPDVADLMNTAASAARSPDVVISDIAGTIVNMAPLTSDALAQWQNIASIVTKLPATTDVAARVLWPGTVNMAIGMIPILGAIYDFEPKYGQQYLYPMLDVLAVGIHIAATNVGPVQQAFGALPALASAARVVANSGNAGVKMKMGPLRMRAADPADTCHKLNAVQPDTCRVSADAPGTVEVNTMNLMTGGMGR